MVASRTIKLGAKQAQNQAALLLLNGVDSVGWIRLTQSARLEAIGST